MLENNVWQQAATDITKMMCIGCAENNLGRQLNKEDFTTVPVPTVRKTKKQVNIRYNITDNNTLETNMTKRTQILKEYLKTFPLPDNYIEYITKPENNPAQHSYHNAHHCHTVAVNTILAADYYKLADLDKLELIIAAIFHDWNHSGGELSETENIEQAIIGYNTSVNIFRIKNLNHHNIIKLIRATQYPRYPAFELKEQIIQDADLLQYLHNDRLTWIEAYNNEQHENKTPENVADFIASQKFNTQWGKEKAAETISHLIKTSL